LAIAKRPSRSDLVRNGTVILCVMTLLLAVIYPVPFCIGCEFAKPWGHVPVWQEDIVLIWLLAAPFLAGLFVLKKGGLVPLIAVFALVIVQPLAGVAWWSLLANEGPFIILLGSPIAAACYGGGRLVRLIAT
jgi:hypothetical protein